MSSDNLDRDFEHDGTTYTGKLRKQEGQGGGWMFMAFKDGGPFGPALPNIEAADSEAAMDKAIESFVAEMNGS